jgi:hypothetical protein
MVWDALNVAEAVAAAAAEEEGEEEEACNLAEDCRGCCMD